MNLVVLIARLLLATVFGVAGIAKLLDLAGFRKSVGEFGVPVFLALPLTVLLPLLELACAVALIPASSAWWGAGGALAMLLVFMVAIAANLVRGHKPDCHCFGQFHSSPVSWATFSRNAGLAGVAALVVWQGPNSAGPSVVDWLGIQARSDSVWRIVLMAIVAITTIELWALFQLLRQNGRLLLRLDAVEAKVGISAESTSLGLPVNSLAPGFSLESLDHGTESLDTLRDRGKSLLLFFTEPGCGACDAAFPEVAQWQDKYADRLVIVPIATGDAHINRVNSRKYNLLNVLVQAGREVAQAYRVEATPSAVLVKKGLIASPLAVGVDAIRALVVKTTLPPAVSEGDVVPSLRLPDLDGGTTDLIELRGRRTLLLFWNPTCGFCEAILDDVKTWERTRPLDAPELLIISAGSSEANRGQGFRSPVLLDHDFSAGKVFGAGGTPSAVVLDEEGRVASSLGVGTEAVLALVEGTIPVRNRVLA